jgi:hypothetical protein
MGQVFDELNGRLDAVAKAQADALARIQTVLTQEAQAISERDSTIAEIHGDLHTARSAASAPAAPTAEEVAGLEARLSALQEAQDSLDSLIAAVPITPPADPDSAPPDSAD